jgi:hypothetical protein
MDQSGEHRADAIAHAEYRTRFVRRQRLQGNRELDGDCALSDLAARFDEALSLLPRCVSVGSFTDEKCDSLTRPQEVGSDLGARSRHPL